MTAAYVLWLLITISPTENHLVKFPMETIGECRAIGAKAIEYINNNTEMYAVGWCYANT